MEQPRSQAIVVRKVAYGEADLVLTLLCRDLGKLSALARGARRSQRRFGAALELFTVSTVQLRAHRGELWTLSSAETVTSFAHLARDVGTLAHASYGTELVRELSAAEQPDAAVFDLLVDLFAALSRRGARADVLRAFELALLDATGLAPALETCAACGGDGALDRGALLDPARGGVVCASCAPASRTAGVRPLSASARTALVAAQRAARAGQLAQVELDPGDAAAETRDAMLALIGHHVGRPLRTLEFLGKLNRPAT
jgi:DNA repair protein RecO (recombination protein O)